MSQTEEGRQPGETGDPEKRYEDSSTVPGASLHSGETIDTGPLTPMQSAYLCSQVMGWRVFPIRVDTKVPAIKKWPERATTDLDQVRAWFAYAGWTVDVGILTGRESNLWVLDIDVKWCNGLESVRDLFHRHGVTEVPRTWRVSTPSGGQQWYFTWPTNGLTVRNTVSELGRVGRLGPGLEVRGWHGQVVAPNGQRRRVLDDHPPAAAPDWLVDLVTVDPHRTRTPAERYGARVTGELARRALEAVAARLAEAGNGGRNAELNSAAFSLGGLASVSPLDEDATREALREACVANGLLGEEHGEQEFEATFNSGWNAGLRSGGTK